MNTRGVAFDCAGDTLIGVLNEPPDAAKRAVIILVGGPQYRVGSHRQFYYMAEHVARESFIALRFDYRGMGDSEGASRGFEDVSGDIRSAIDFVCRECPSVEEVVLVGLCDAASAAMMYAADDERVTGLALMNPWVRTEETLARVTLKRYYLRRLVSGELWSKILRGQFDFGAAVKSFSDTLKSLFSGGRGDSDRSKGPYTARMLNGIEAFDGQVLMILSGDDLTAMEFRDETKKVPRWQESLSRAGCTRYEFGEADHTFSSAAWRGQVNDWITEWLRSW